MEAKNWFKWVFIFGILIGFTSFVFYPTETIPYVEAYSWEEAQEKIDWNLIENNTILIYTQETDFVGKSYGGTGWFAIWKPAQENFYAFIHRYCYTYEKLNNQGKIVHVFKEQARCNGGNQRWDSLSKEVKNAYQKLRPRELRGTMTKGSMSASSVVVS